MFFSKLEHFQVSTTLAEIVLMFISSKSFDVDASSQLGSQADLDEPI